MQKVEDFFRVIVAESILCCNLAETKRSKVMNKTEIKLNEKNLKDGFSFIFRNEDGNEFEAWFSNEIKKFCIWNFGKLKSFKTFSGMKKALDNEINQLELELSEINQ